MIKPVNAINFKAVSISNRNQFSQNQENVTNDIIKKLQRSYIDKQTVMQYFEQNNQNFSITPLENDAVKLDIVENNTSKRKSATTIPVGVYTSDNTFEINDAIFNPKEKKKMLIATFGIYALMGAAVALMYLFGGKHSIKNPQSIEKFSPAKIENTISSTKNSMSVPLNYIV